MREMAHAEAIAFLSAGTRTGKLAVTRADGAPHVTPVWFVVDDGDLVFTTWHTSVKAASIVRDPRVALVVDHEEPPYAFVMVEGTASIIDEVREVRRIATLSGARYMGEDRAGEFGERNGVEGELVMRIAIDRIVAFDQMTG